MIPRPLRLATLVLVAAPAILHADGSANPTASAMPTDCPYHAAHMAAAAGESNHKHELDARGDTAMGFSQAATTHHFQLSADGGSIEVTSRDPSDGPTVAAIRDHLKMIARQFAAGDFSTPEAVHAQTPPGVEGMEAAASDINYLYQQVGGGGRVVIHAPSPATVASVHDFLRFQILEHETGDSGDVR